MIKQLYNIANACILEMRQNERMIMTDKDEKTCQRKMCHICNKEIYYGSKETIK